MWKLIELEKKDPLSASFKLGSSKDYKIERRLKLQSNVRAGGNATYTSKMAVVEFVNTLGICVEESLPKWLRKAPF